jgi:glutamate dehydrogenase/leucine dehydrogenase
VGRRTSSTSGGTSATSTTSSAAACAGRSARSDERAQRDDVPLRIAAYMIGMERVVEAARTRGYV